MTTPRITWAISFTVQAPFSTASALPARIGIDTPLLRNHRDEVIIPGTLVQGRLFEEVNNWPALRGLVPYLGDPARDDAAANAPGQRNVPHRKQLLFSDFVMHDSPPIASTQTFTRIAINEATGSVKTGALQVIEQAARSGAPLTFTGTLTGYVATDQREALTEALRGALGLITNFGGERSVGYGVIKGVKIEDPTVANPTPFTWPNDATTAALTLHFDRPVLVAEPNPNANLFHGGGIIPGNVIKGALADTLKAVTDALPNGFDQLIVRHGFCAPGEARPRAIPLSLSEFKNDTTQVVDLATLAEPQILGAAGAMTAAKFVIDWKEPDLNTPVGKPLSAHYGWAHPERDLRVRVAIDPATRAAEDEKLFAYDAVLHERSVGENYVANAWQTVFDLSKVDAIDRPALITGLNAAFAAGLFPLGKTKAVASVAALSAPVATPALAIKALAALIVLTLQTPALLTAKGAVGTGANSGSLHAAYAEYFGIHGFTLSHFYARQTLRGGGYQQRRFQGTQAYAPWLLTDAGSVFVLTVTDAARANEALTTLTLWQSTGLPVASGWPAKWNTNPYLPENGFGEVRLNEPEHHAWSPATLNVCHHPVASLVA